MDNLNLEDEAAFYNKIPILEVLTTYCTKESNVKNIIEVASGLGIHAAYFCENLPSITHFQPTEKEVKCFSMIQKLTKNQTAVQTPLELDVLNDSHWKSLTDNFYDLGIVTNMCHISPWECTEALFAGVVNKLKDNSYFLIYGPFMVNFKPTTESNAKFDNYLKNRNSLWGLRDVTEVEAAAKKVGIIYQKKIEMPENNFILVFKKEKN